MKLMRIVGAFILIITSSIYAESITVHAQQYGKIELAVVVIGTEYKELARVANQIRRDLQFTQQFDVQLLRQSHVARKTDVQRIASKGHALAIFLQETADKKGIEWRLYDTHNVVMLTGKRYHKRGPVMRGWAHNIVDQIWPELTRQEGFFSTKIAYCKKMRHGRKMHQYICIADYNGSHEQILVSGNMATVGPRWNTDVTKPLLFYSAYTPSNLRLIAIDMNKQQKVASNFDGINMLTSFSKDGKKVVYCASRGSGGCDLYYYEKGIFKRLTNNNGNNVSPSLSDDGSCMVFCSDFQTGNPQIYMYDMETGDTKRLTKGGYCACPSYCQKNNMIAYTKLIQGEMQLFIYDMAKDMHQQISFGPGSKQECCWSPCGNYVLFGIEHGNKSRIAMCNIVDHTTRYITPASGYCTYPSWSGIYSEFPVVQPPHKVT